MNTATDKDVATILRRRPSGPWSFTAPLNAPGELFTFDTVNAMRVWLKKKAGMLTVYEPFPERHPRAPITNRLALQRRFGAGSWDEKQGRGHNNAHRALLDDWAAINGLRRCVEFDIGTLARGGSRVRESDAWEMPKYWHGRRTPECFKRGRNAAAMVIEPYPGDHVDGLFDYLHNSDAGLMVDAPPNPFASFWYPGETLFLVITRDDFGDVEWLMDQLNFGVLQNG